jgi:hypothetical protein
MKTHTYFASGFKTTGNWIIPFILGWSKSTVMMGSRPIGIMFTLHITPYINIGWNNPNPKYKEHSGCDCGCCDHDYLNSEQYSPEVEEAIKQAEAFSDSCDNDKVTGFYIHDLEDNKIEFVFYVTDLAVEVPEEFNGMKAEKRLDEAPADLHEEYHDYCSNPEHRIAFQAADDFVLNTADKTKIFGYYPENIEDNMIFVFGVLNMDVDIPEEFNGIRTRKEISKSIEEQHKLNNDIPY